MYGKLSLQFHIKLRKNKFLEDHYAIMKNAESLGTYQYNITWNLFVKFTFYSVQIRSRNMYVSLCHLIRKPEVQHTHIQSKHNNIIQNQLHVSANIKRTVSLLMAAPGSSRSPSCMKLYQSRCTADNAPDDGQKNCPKHVELLCH